MEKYINKKELIDLHNLGDLLAILGIVTGIIATCLSIYWGLNRAHLGIAVTFACLIHVFHKYKSSFGYFREMRKWQQSDRFFIVLTIVFFLLLFTSILFLKTSLYYRPVSYLVAFVGASTILIFQIFQLDCTKSWKLGILLSSIFVLGLSYKASVFFLYPTVTGYDPFFHQKYIDEIILSGQLPTTSIYSSFPITHLLVSAFCLVSGLPSKVGLFIITILQSFALLSVYGIAKNVFSVKVGLIAAILISLSDFQIIWGIQVVPTTLGVILFILMIYCLFQRYITDDTKNRMAWTFLLLIIIALAIPTHTLSSLILLLGLVIAVISTYFLSKRTARQILFADYNLLIFYSIGVVTYWGGISQQRDSEDFFTWVVNALKIALFSLQSETEGHFVYQHSNGWTTFLGEIGWTLLLIPAVCGALTLLNKKNRTATEIYLVNLFMGFMVIIYVSALFGILSLVPDRWMVFLYIPACILAANFLWNDLIFIRNREILSFLKLVFTLGIVVFMITSPIRSLQDSPLYGKELSHRQGFFRSEVVGLEFARHKFNESMAVSDTSRLYLGEGRIINPSEPDTYTNEAVLVIRDVDRTRGFYIPMKEVNKGKGDGRVLPSNDFTEFLNNNSILQVYDNSSVQIFWNTGIFK